MGDSQQKQEESLVNLEKTEVHESGEAERSTFTCEICIEPMSSVEKFDNNERCIHPFCTDCLAKYIQAKVEEKVANIKCPALNCNQLLDPLICQTIISVELFNKWCDCLCDASLLVLHRCYCPYQNCSALVISECGEAVKKSKCPNCKRFFCFTCKVPWHSGFWCTETRQKRDANDVAFGVLLEKNKWNRCPYCGQAVEHIAGCRAVKCRCGFLFCHKCGGSSCRCGQEVAANCVAMVPSGQIFDSSLEKGQLYIFRVGSGQVIKGLDEGILSMKVGGKRRLYIPGSLAFSKGLTSAPGRPRVAPNSPVIFDVSLEYIPGLELDEE